MRTSVAAAALCAIAAICSSGAGAAAAVSAAEPLVPLEAGLAAQDVAPAAWPFVRAADRARFAEVMSRAGEEVRLSARMDSMRAALEDGGAPRRTKQATVNKLYQLLKDTGDALDANECKYWAEGGTFLGAVRHKGLMYWDDDGDIGMWESDEDCFTGAQDTLREAGICTLKWYYGYKIFPCKGTPVADNPKVNYPFLDLFLVDCAADGKTYYPRTNWYKACRYDCKDLHKLRKMPFGPLSMPVAGSNSYLDRCYGPTWSTHGKEGKDHSTGDENAGQPEFQLTPELTKPAVPDIKLADNIA